MCCVESVKVNIRVSFMFPKPQSRSVLENFTCSSSLPKGLETKGGTKSEAPSILLWQKLSMRHPKVIGWENTIGTFASEKQ